MHVTTWKSQVLTLDCTVLPGELAVLVGRRKYDDGCAVAQALDVVGERWALLLVRDLLLGPKRFTDLLAGLPGASSHVVTNDYRDLADAGVNARRRLPPPGERLGVRADALGC